MNKKILGILLVIFSACFLSISCSSKDKTAPSGIIDSKYAGNWHIKTEEKVFLKITSDGNCSFPQLEAEGGKIKEVKGSGNSYSIVFTDPNFDSMTVKIEFTSDKTGNVKKLQNGITSGMGEIEKR